MTVSNSTQYSSNLGIRNGFLYLLVGGGIGAAVALLFAPKSGADLRGDISDLTRKGYEGTLELADNLKSQSADVLQTLKEKKDQVYDFAATKLARAESGVENAIDTAGDVINGEIQEIDNKLSQKSLNTGRKSSSIV